MASPIQAAAADVPPLTTEDGIERRSRRGHRPARQAAQHDRVVALLEHRIKGDLAIGGIPQSRDQLVVFGFGPVLFLLEARRTTEGSPIR